MFSSFSTFRSAGNAEENVTRNKNRGRNLFIPLSLQLKPVLLALNLESSKTWHEMACIII
jgi:hypothetical protein